MGESSTTDESRAFNFSVGATASFSAPLPFVPDVTVSGDYSSTSIEASETTIEDSQGLTVNLGSRDGTIAGANYSVTPFVYWSDSGAVVLDYAVETFSTPSNPSFWDLRYGSKPDPTFVLPLRHDPEKGLALTNDRLRRKTNEILTLPLEPRLGEEVEVNARLSNFSFVNVEEDFNVDFYLGEPGMGGSLIHTETVSAGSLSRQDKYLIKFSWKVPRSISSTSFEIHAVIDASDVVDEVHEDNNTGWSEIFVRRNP